jgi:hypothetical protein
MPNSIEGLRAHNNIREIDLHETCTTHVSNITRTPLEVASYLIHTLEDAKRNLSVIAVSPGVFIPVIHDLKVLELDRDRALLCDERLRSRLPRSIFTDQQSYCEIARARNKRGGLNLVG